MATPSKAAAFIKSQPLEMLIDSFEMTNNKNGQEIPTVRGWLMDELEARDPEAFERWIDSGADSPRKYYL